MKRWSAILVSILVLTLVSCDAMFEKNLFAGMTQKELTADTVSGMNSTDVAALTESEAQMAMLRADPEAKAAAITVLEAEYLDPVAAATPTGQEAAVAAATIIIQTVPEAAAFSSSAVMMVLELMDPPEGEEPDIGAALESMLPDDVTAAIDGGQPDPPASFAAIVEAFYAVNDVYGALSDGMSTMGAPAFVSTEITADVQMSLVVNAAIGFALANVQDDVGTMPATAEDLTNLLWSALVDPNITLTFPEFTAMPADLSNLFTAAGLGDVFSD